MITSLFDVTTAMLVTLRGLGDVENTTGTVVHVGTCTCSWSHRVLINPMRPARAGRGQLVRLTNTKVQPVTCI